jgi:phage protein U
MAIAKSFQRYDAIPSAIITDGMLINPFTTVPLWAVTSMSLSEAYHLPPIGSTGARSIVATHDDTVSLSGVLLGAERYAWKLALESMAETSRRGGFMAGVTGGNISGLILITTMTIRTDMQVQSLTFSTSAAKRDALDVSITLVHMPLPGALGKLLDVLSLGVGALADWGETKR